MDDKNPWEFRLFDIIHLYVLEQIRIIAGDPINGRRLLLYSRLNETGPPMQTGVWGWALRYWIGLINSMINNNVDENDCHLIHAQRAFLCIKHYAIGQLSKLTFTKRE